MASIPYTTLLRLVVLHQADLLTVLRPSIYTFKERLAVVEASNNVLAKQLAAFDIALVFDPALPGE